MSNPVCIVMVKASRAEAIKARLVPPLSGTDAATLTACFAQDVVANARRVVPQVIVAFTPADASCALEELLPHKDLLWIQQRGEDLGVRMEAAALDAMALGFSPIIITGTDSPTLLASYIETAVESLAANESDMVISPVDDGGYCLIGFRQYPNHLFQNIRWSTPLADQQTADNAKRLKLQLLALPRCNDVDTFYDLLRLRDEVMTNEASQARAPATYQWLLAHDALFS